MSPGDSTVLFQALPTPLRLSPEDRRSLTAFANVLSSTVADARPFTCLITNDHKSRKLNREFLRNDYATDVLSFPSEGLEADERNRNFLGDIAISIERADAQALAFGHSRLEEVRLLMLHGVLHLVGFDHETDRGEMARAERKWRRYFDLPSSLIARTNTRTTTSTQRELRS